MPTKKQLSDLAKVIATHQANLSRLGEAWGQKICDALDDTDRSLIAHLKDLLKDVQDNYKVNTQKSIDQLAYIRSKIEEIRVRAFVKAEKELRAEAPDLIDNETKWSKRILSELSGEKASRFADLTPKQIDKVLNNGIIQNKPWADWWTYTASNDVQRIANVVNAGVVQGFTIDQMTRLIMGTKKGNYTDGVLSTTRASARNLARTMCSGLANQAKDEFYRQNDDVVIGVEWLDTLDGRTCPSCAGLSRKRWKTDEPHPVPPIHPSCYDKETRVLTDKGLKYFADLDGTEQFFSFNPETEQIELVKAVRLIRYPVNEKLLHFTNARFDLMVTKNHRMFGYLKANKCIPGYRFYEAEKMPRSKYRIPSGGQWIGERHELTPERIAWLKFMAYWLADGSVTQRSEGHYQIKIAQYNNAWMREELKAFPYPLGNQESCLMFSDKDLGKYLAQFGHAAEKFIPEDIKNSSPEEIRIFLEAFAKTDGCVREGKNWKGYQFGPSMYFFTSSERMRDDLCEMVLKAGGRPSVSVQHTAGTKQTFRNGTYTINADGYIISFCKQTGTFSDTLKHEEVDYSGDVFCVELAKNHTLYVERNGKFCWCGNCRCVLLPVTELSDLGEDAPRPMANADFDAEAKRYYEQDHPGKHFDDLAQSTREQYRHKAIHRWEKETGRKAYTQVSGNMTFKDYFEQMSDQQKRDWLGKSRFEMWKSGKYEVSDFIPPYPDKAMTVKQLKAIDKESFNAPGINGKKERIIEWLKENRGENVSVDGLDDKTLNIIANEMESLSKDVPILKEKYKTIGITNDKVAAQANHEIIEFNPLYINTSKDLENILKTEVQNRSMVLANELEEIKNNKSMRKFQKDGEIARIKYQMKFSRGAVAWTHPIEEYIRGSVAHESGHTIMFRKALQQSTQLGIQYDKTPVWSKIASVRNKAILRGDIYNISEYASKNEMEFFSETFAIYRLEKSKLPDYIIKMIEEVIK